MNLNDLFEPTVSTTVPVVKSRPLVVTDARSLAERLKTGPAISFMNEIDPVDRITYEDFEYSELNTYAGLDCIATSGILGKVWPTIVASQPAKIPDEKGKPKAVYSPAIIESVTNIEMKAHEFVLNLEINGISYDVDKNQDFDRRMTSRVAELDDKIFSAIGQKLDLNSGAAIAKFLYDERGFTPPNFTKSGDPSSDGPSLLILAGLDPLGGKYIAPDPALQYLGDIAQRRDIATVHSTFIKTYVKDFVKRTGRIHPSYNLFGTSSFRITGSDPNLTQLPRGRLFNVRECFNVAPGFCFIALDFSSAEVKILANLSRDPAMLEAVRRGLDFHAFSMGSMHGIPYDEVMAVLGDPTHRKFKEYKAKRQISKVLTFSILYGSSVGGIAKQLNIETSEAERLIALYFDAFPGVKKFIENAHNTAIWNQLVWTPLGQFKREYGTHQCFRRTAAYNAALRNSANVLIQSTTSSIGLVTFAELDSRIQKYGAKSICTVYDSIEIECPIEHAAAVINVAFETLDDYPLECFDFMTEKIGAEAEVGWNWGSCDIVHAGVTQTEVESVLKKKSESV